MVHNSTLVLIYVDKRRKIRFEIDVDCLSEIVKDLLDLENVFDIASHIGLIVQTLLEKIDEGYQPRRAIYSALYVLLQDLGVRKYFDFAERVDKASRCVTYSELKD
ncbi:MAG: hypothetical protein GXO23_06765 [Crenarchaeota archaeon]|nr:hypothetical protein [Thermoproteota archaeon]